MPSRYPKNKKVGNGGREVYEIDEFLNSGGFANSYKARDSSGNFVFIKQYKSPTCTVDWYREFIDYQAEVKRRIEACNDLRGRTYKFIQSFEDEKKVFVQVYEFIAGGKDLKDHLTDPELTWAQKYTFAMLLMYSIKLLHAAGIVHTDLKPDNLYLMPCDAKMGYNLKLIDFDFSVIAGKKAPWDGKMGYCGTPRYLSPEHLAGKMPTTESDVFTCGIILHEIFTGKNPFPANDDAYKNMVAEYSVRALRCKKSAPSKAQSLFDLIHRALDPKPANRPTADNLHRALGEAKAELSGGIDTIGVKTTSRNSESTIHASSSERHNPPVLGGAAIRVGIGPLNGDPISWHNIRTSVGQSLVRGILGESAKLYASSEQFIIERDGEGWAIIEVPNTKNLTEINGVRLVGRKPLADGNIVSLGSRSGNGKTKIAPVRITLKKADKA
jgi:serine/threonine protein kinase